MGVFSHTGCNEALNSLHNKVSLVWTHNSHFFSETTLLTNSKFYFTNYNCRSVVASYSSKLLLWKHWQYLFVFQYATKSTAFGHEGMVVRAALTCIGMQIFMLVLETSLVNSFSWQNFYDIIIYNTYGIFLCVKTTTSISAESRRWQRPARNVSTWHVAGTVALNSW